MTDNSRYRRILRHSRSFTITVGSLSIFRGFLAGTIGSVDNSDHYGDELTQVVGSTSTNILSVDFLNALDNVLPAKPNTLFLRLQGYPHKLELTWTATAWVLSDPDVITFFNSKVGETLNCSLSY